MWLHRLALVALAVGVVSGQRDFDDPNGKIRRLRFRRPRPRVVPIDDVDGAQEGNPVPIRAVPVGVPVDQLGQENTAALLAAAFDEEQEVRAPVRGRPANDAALEALFNTAQREPAPIDEEVQEPILPLAPAPARRRPAVGRTRQPPSIPRRAARPRPQPVDDEEEIGSSRRPSRVEEEPVVGTVERYSHRNEDGSFTFGYMSEDGSFREETRGVDCITRGKYGYIDPDGKRREFTYVSGLPCEVGEDGLPIQDDEDELQEVGEDPINPAERFRTAQAVQLSEDEIPVARQRQRVIASGRRPEGADPRQRVRGQPRRRPAQSGGALDNLLNIADQNEEVELTPTRRPVARPTPTRARPTPTRARPAPASPRPSAFDFETELDDFTLNKPALTFSEQSRGAPASPAPTPVGPNFSSELVFNPETGTFQTELRQNIRGGSEIRLANPAAPAARRPAPTPTPTAAAPRRPAPTPTKTFSATPIPQARPAAPGQARPTPFTAFAQTSRPTAVPQGPIKFEPLSFPDPSSVRVPAPSPTPAARPPTPTIPARPPVPTQPARPVTPRPVTPTQPANSFFFNPGSPTPTAARPTPAAIPRPTPTAARPPPPPRPTPTAARPASVIPANTFNLAQQPARPAPRPVQPRPIPPQPVQQRRPLTQPQVQFGFQPLQQQGRPQQSAPFTAFAQGTPPQLRGVPPPQPFQQARPQTSFVRGPPQQQFQVRPPPQQRPPLGVPPQLQQGARFQQPGFRPPPQQAQPQFSVFNPNQLRGA